MSQPGEGAGDGPLDLAAALGAEAAFSTQALTLYIPNKDRAGQEIGTQRRWVLEAIDLLARVGGGATALPPVEGVWVNEAGQFVWDNPVMVYTYVKPEEFAKRLPEVRAFLHRLGRETDQGEVAVEFNDEFYRIRTFDGTGG
jgi:hypothetical protein